jgi:tape measure domain-containing protein
MVEYRIDVIFDPKQAQKGIKQVDKELVRVGNTADRVRNQIAKLFKFAAVVYAVKQIVDLADAYTNLQNRLRVVTKGTADLADTTERLLQVANRSRSSFEGTAELYTRVALATRQMGVAQKELAPIVETVNKAIILSGASAKEANNGLIQLSQGIAANRLGGDELRSVLEQLPVVADVIAKQMGVTRGEMRALGAEGKITGDVVIKAFKNAREEIEKKFAKTVPTLAQSWVVLKNNFLAFLGEVNTSTGVLGTLGAAMRTLGENINFVAKSLITLGVVFASVKLAPYAQGLFDSAKAALAFNKAVKAGTVVVLGSAEAERQKAAASVASLAAERSATAATLARVKAEAAKAVVVKGSATSEFAYIAVQKQISALQGTLTTQTNAYTAAQARLTLATKAANKEASLFYRLLGKIKIAINAVTSAMARNPIGAMLVAITAIIAPLIIFRKEIKLSEDSLGTLADLGTVIWERLKVNLEGFVTFFKGAMQRVSDFFSQAFGGMELTISNVLLFIAAFIDTTLGLFKGLSNSIPVVLNNLPNAIADVFVKAVNGIIGIFETMVDGITALFVGLGSYVQSWAVSLVMFLRDMAVSARQALVGNMDEAASTASYAVELLEKQWDNLSIVDSINDEFNRLDQSDLFAKVSNPFEGAANELGSKVMDAFKKGLEDTPVADVIADILGEVERFAGQNIINKFREANQADEEGGTVNDRAPQIEQLLRQIDAENQLLANMQVTNAERELGLELLKIEQGLIDKKIKYTEDDLKRIAGQKEYNQMLKTQIQVLNELRGPQEELAQKEQALTALRWKGIISIEEYNEAMRDLAVQSAQYGKSIGDGITRGLAAVEDNLTDIASAVENVFVNAFSSAEDALVDFVMTGQFSFRDFARGIIKDITKVIAKLLILQAIQAITGTSGSNVFGSLTGRAEGGAVKKHEPVIVGEKGPELFNPETSGMVIPNDVTAAIGQVSQEAPIVNIAPPPPANVTVVNSIDSGEVFSSGANSPDGEQAILNVISKNRENVKRSLG